MTVQSLTGSRSVLADYVTLTKPRIISLLLLLWQMMEVAAVDCEES